jgi:histidine ammonia-lyase
MLRHDILPVIPTKGSVGASGDLAPLSHLALTVIGEGEVFFRGRRCATMEAFQACALKPVAMGPKEGLSITNGTQFMAARAGLLAVTAEYLLEAADYIGAMSLDAFKGTTAAFDRRIHVLKGQPGQIEVADKLNAIFAESDGIRESHEHCGKVQDPYSFRCMPQVHGASRDAYRYCQSVIENELNAVSDNPLIFDDGSVVSGGNFHGQSIAMALDVLAIAIAEIGSISEQRTMKLTNPSMSGMAPFLIADSGLNSGFMIPHVVAASLVSENKILCHPAVVDSIPTSADKEDHVSMGPIAAHKAVTVVDNVSTILAIELIAACQGVDMHLPLKPNRVLQRIHDAIRVMCPFMDRDISLAKPITDVSQWIANGGLHQLLADAHVADVRRAEEINA